MKAIQISIDEELLKRLDQDEEVKKEKRRKGFAEAYSRAYAKGTPADLLGWADGVAT